MRGAYAYALGRGGATRASASSRARGVHTVVMIRHGESAWNVGKRFTGWCDIPLTESGQTDAKDAGRLMLERGMKFDVAFTSGLERAWRTCALALSHSDQSGVETVKTWQLNERHYGALQGHLKNCPKLIAEFGEQQLIEWRRSYNTAPPSLRDANILPKLDPESVKLSNAAMDPRYFDTSAAGILTDTANGNVMSVAVNSKIFPATESLKDCEKRAFSYWEKVIAPRVRNGERVLIVAHANTIRALVKAVDHIRDDMIQHLRIPNGIPLVYTLDANLQPIIDSAHDIGFQAKYLISPHNHSKMMAYESCTRKKLVALFEYLDKDRDGFITPFDLQSGMAMLQLQGFDPSGGHASKASQRAEREICEFEIEELLRCVPQTSATGSVSLRDFLDGRGARAGSGEGG